MYRAKNRTSNNWMYGSLIEDGVNSVIVNDKVLKKYSDVDDLLVFNRVRKETVSQATGHTDKNNKEVYAGDYIKMDNGVVLKVVYDTKRARFIPDVTSDNYFYQMFWENIGEYEIIGNIYDDYETCEPLTGVGTVVTDNGIINFDKD